MGRQPQRAPSPVGRAEREKYEKDEKYERRQRLEYFVFAQNFFLFVVISKRGMRVIYGNPTRKVRRSVVRSKAKRKRRLRFNPRLKLFR